MTQQPQPHTEEIPWQHAVYTRRTQRDVYTFSHAGTSALRKAFPASLSVPSLRQTKAIRAQNLEQLRNAPVLVLVTGNWAIHVSIEAYQGNLIGRLPLKHYDHLSRLGQTDSALCSELAKDYRALKYHCTMASYDPGQDHAWRLQSVATVLSDIVILPQYLEETRLRAVMTSFCRASKKALRDSLLLAGDRKVKEETL
jgi:hypothetical protein